MGTTPILRTKAIHVTAGIATTRSAIVHTSFELITCGVEGWAWRWRWARRRAWRWAWRRAWRWRWGGGGDGVGLGRV